MAKVKRVLVINVTPNWWNTLNKESESNANRLLGAVVTLAASGWPNSEVRISPGKVAVAVINDDLITVSENIRRRNEVRRAIENANN